MPDRVLDRAIREGKDESEAPLLGMSPQVTNTPSPDHPILRVVSQVSGYHGSMGRGTQPSLARIAVMPS